jgi:hypothetical protein
MEWLKVVGLIVLGLAVLNYVAVIAREARNIRLIMEGSYSKQQDISKHLADIRENVSDIKTNVASLDGYALDRSVEKMCEARAKEINDRRG